MRRWGPKALRALRGTEEDRETIVRLTLAPVKTNKQKAASFI